MWPDSPRDRSLVKACGMLGPLMLAAYFAAPLLEPPLARLVYAPHPTTAQVVDIGRRYHELLYAGTWLQATGALLAVIFFLALADLTGGTRPLAAKITQLGSAVLLTWASAAVDGQATSSRASFDLMSAFIRVFPLVPAPALYLSVGVLLLGVPVLPSAFARLALALGAAFAVTGLIGIFLSAAAAATAGLSGLQVLWVIAAAIALQTTTAHRQPAAVTSSATEAAAKPMDNI